MKQNISIYDFERAFSAMDRDNFSYHGLKALFDYLEQFEEDCDQEIELDVVALCCEYTEYKNVADFLNDYKSTITIKREDYEDDDIEGYNEAVLEQLREHTQVIEIEDKEGFIIQDF